MWRVCWLAKELLASQGIYCMRLSSQSVAYSSLGILFLFLVFTEEVLFFCTHKHRTLTILSSIMQNISSSLCTTILELLLPGSAEAWVSVTKWLTVTWHSSKFLINVSGRKHTDHIHVIKHTTLHTVTHAHFYQALTLNSATIQCEQQCKPKLSATKIWGNSFKWNFSEKSSCLSVHIMDTVRTQLYAILPSAYC